MAERINGIIGFDFDDSRVRTDAEIQAGIYPSNPAFPPGDVRRYGALGDGATNDWDALQRAALVINEQGGGRLEFAPGANYLIYVGSQTGNLFSLADLDGLEILGNGCTLTVDLTRNITNSLGICFSLSNCKNVYCDGFNTNGPTLDVSSSTVKSVEFMRCVDGCKNIRLGTNRIVNWAAGFLASKDIGDPESDRSQNIVIDTLEVVNSWYGIHTQFSGDNLVCHALKTDTIHRSVFNYGCSHQHIKVWSKDHKGTDVRILAADADTATGVSLEDIHIEYHSGTDSVTCGAAAKIYVGPWGDTAMTVKNVRLDLDIRYNASGNTGDAAVVITKLQNDDSADTTDRGHTFDGITIAGSVLGTPSSTGFGGLIVTDPNATFGTGDFFRNWNIENLRTDSSTLGIVFSLASLVDQITLKGVSVAKYIALRQSSGDTNLPHTGMIELQGVQCTNRWANDGSVLALDNIHAGTTTPTLRAGWCNGKTVTTRSAGGNMTWAMPAATVGREIKGVRDGSVIISFDPNGTDTIGAGGAGKYRRSNDAGATIHLRCFVAGNWAIAGEQGTWEAEP